MAGKVEKLGGRSTAATLFAAVFSLNWLSGTYFGYPFAWCFGKLVIQPILEPWTFVTHFLALCYFGVSAWSLNAISMLKGLCVVVAVFGLPTFLEILFRLGKSCG